MHPTPADLVAAAAHGDEAGWTALVRRYTPLVLSVINSYGLRRADAADVNQTVWLRLVEHLGRLRDPDAVATWLATTTRRECYRVLRAGRRIEPFDPSPEAAGEGIGAVLPSDSAPPEERLLRAERHQALRDGLAQLPSRCQQLLSMLAADPPASYQEISDRLQMPIGSIGPTQARCLRKLRHCPAIAEFVAASRSAEGGEGDRDDATPMVR